jgi:hypothetical protein
VIHGEYKRDVVNPLCRPDTVLSPLMSRIMADRNALANANEARQCKRQKP